VGQLGPESLQAAEAHFRRAIEINPNFADAHIWLGHFVLNRNEYVESFALYQKAVQLDPLSIPAKNNLARALLWRGRLDEARQVVEKMASLNPGGHLWWLADLKSNGGNWADGALAILDVINPAAAGVQRAADQVCAHGHGTRGLADPDAVGPNSQGLTELEATPVGALSLLGRPAEAVTAWERLPGGIPQEPGRGYLPSGVLIAAAGDNARAGPILERVWPLFRRSAGIASPSRDANFVLALMSVRRERGDEAGISELKAALKDAIRRYSEAGLVLCDVFEGCVHFDAGVSAYLDGDREDGLALIAKSIESGYFIAPNRAYLQFLYDDPAFGPILEQQTAHQTRQREKFLSVVCSDNPYADVWEPGESRCRGFQNGRQ
jgi:tetratricopeptide (TPR) repeat protein